MHEDFSFGSWLKQRREALHLTQQELAEKLGCGESTIGAYEREDRRPRRAMAERLAEILAIPAPQRVEFVRVALGQLSCHYLPAPTEGAAPAAPPLDRSALDTPTTRPILRPSGGGASPATPPFMPSPLPPQGVFGRDDDLTRIINALQLDADTSEGPLALVGLGGVGKTTLALKLGHWAPRRFPDGVLWATVGPSPSLRPTLEAWGWALGENLVIEPSPEACGARLQSLLRHKRMLLIVDDVWSLPTGRAFLLGGPLCRTVITTREPWLAYAFATPEQSLRVDVLSPAASLQLLRRLAPNAVRQDEATAQVLCHKLEYLPLALTLAGRLIALESDIPRRAKRLIQDLIEHHEARLRLLQIEGRLGVGDDQPVSLEAILGLSVQRLTLEDQQRFAALSVFGGEPCQWDIEEAANLWACAMEDAEATVIRLIQRGLVEPRQGRYWVHALFANYGTELRRKMGW